MQKKANYLCSLVFVFFFRVVFVFFSFFFVFFVFFSLFFRFFFAFFSHFFRFFPRVSYIFEEVTWERKNEKKCENKGGKKNKNKAKKQKQSEKKVKTNSSWAFQLLKNISRFAQSGVSSNLRSYRAFPQKVRRGMSWLCFPSAWPSSQSSHQYFAFNLHIQVGFCLIARSQNYTNLPDSWICGR